MALFCCHLFGCLWWMISDLEMQAELEMLSPWYAGENTWHPPRWLKYDSSLTMKYMHAFFWGAGMVTSLVPRDIEPLTVMESLITTSTMFFGLLLNAFVISSLNQVRPSVRLSVRPSVRGRVHRCLGRAAAPRAGRSTRGGARPRRRPAGSAASTR